MPIAAGCMRACRVMKKRREGVGGGCGAAAALLLTDGRFLWLAELGSVRDWNRRRAVYFGLLQLLML